MKLNAVLSALTLLMAGFPASSAFACDCVSYPMIEIPGETDDQKYWRQKKGDINRADWVVSGKIVQSTISHSKSFGIFEVRRVIRGQNIGAFIRVYVSDGSNCAASWLLEEAPKRPDAITLSLTRKETGEGVTYFTGMCHLHYYEGDLLDFLKRSPKPVRERSPDPS